MNRFRSGVRRLGRGAPLALLFVAALSAGCASTGPIEPPADAPDPDKFLFDRGSEYLADEKWSTAREYFRRLVDGYPQSPYRAEAKLGIGDTYLGENSAEGQVYALNEFREFLSFYPTHPRADYAQYRLAMAHFQQMRAPQRDQTATKDAIRELTTFLERYPDSALRPEVETKLREARDRLSRADYEVGLHYFRIRWYPGAIDRFRDLLDRDPDYSYRDAVYFYLGEALRATGRQAEALPYYDRLVQEFEVSDYLKRAKERIAELRK